MLLLLQYTLIFASVLLLVALGGCFSEHSGVINIGLEGIMVMGALGGALMMKFLPAGTSAFVVVLLTVLASILLGMIYSLLLAVAAVNFKADQTLVGTAMNLLGTAAATVFVKAMNTAADPDNVSSTIQYLDGRKAFLVNIGGFEFNWCMLLAVIALVIAYVVLYKTRFGLRLCACGEHPQAADSVGIIVYRMRYAGVLISGVLGGLGGIVYIIAGVSEWKFENGVAGFGFLALAVMIFGQWKPTRIALAALLFGFFRALGNVYSGFDLLSNLNLPSSVYNMLTMSSPWWCWPSHLRSPAPPRRRAFPTTRASGNSITKRNFTTKYASLLSASTTGRLFLSQHVAHQQSGQQQGEGTLHHLAQEAVPQPQAAALQHRQRLTQDREAAPARCCRRQKKAEGISCQQGRQGEELQRRHQDRPQAAAHGGERLRQHIEEHHEGAHRQNPGKRGPDSPGEGLRKADSPERRTPCQLLPGSGFSAAPKHQSRQKGGEHMDQPQPHPGPHTAEHPHAQHTDEEHRIGVVAEGQQPLRLLPGDQIFPVEVCCRLGADGVAPHQPQHQRSTASTGDPEQRLHQPRQPGGGQLPEPQSQQR